MKSILSSFLIVLGLTPCTSTALNTDTSSVERIFNEIQNACTREHTGEECLAAATEIRSNPMYASPEIQFRLSESLVSVSGIHPGALKLAYDILSELIDSYPAESRYKEARAFVSFHEDPLDGIVEARQSDLPGVQSRLLRVYSEQGLIRADIVGLAEEEFIARLERQESVASVLLAVDYMFEVLEEYGGEAERDQFIERARVKIPWNDWRNRELGVLGSMGALSGQQAADLLFTLCRRSMLMLDQGALCKDAIHLIDSSSSRQSVSDRHFLEMAEAIAKTIEIVRPELIGDGLDILKSLTHTTPSPEKAG